MNSNSPSSGMPDADRIALQAHCQVLLVELLELEQSGASELFSQDSRVRATLEGWRPLLKALNGIGLHKIPDQQLQVLKEPLAFLKAFYAKHNIMAHSSRPQFFPGTDQDSRSRLFETYGQAWAAIGSITTLLYDPERDVSERLNEFGSKVAHLETLAKALEGSSRDKVLNTFSPVYHVQIRQHQTAAKLSMGLAILAMVAVVCAGLYFNSQSDQLEWVGVFPRFATISILVGAAVWASKLHRANKHNAVVAQTRALALEVFPTMHAMVQSDTAKEAVLQRAADCVFSHQPTGFSGKDGDGPGITNIVDVFKDGAKKTGA